jgi:N6-adenosine-specific RNA methylase IME4
MPSRQRIPSWWPSLPRYASAERRIGELMEEERKAGLIKEGRPRKRVTEKPISLNKRGIDKNLADRARKAAAMPEAKFEAEVAKVVKVAVAATEGDKAIIREARATQQKEKRARRDQREADLGAKQSALPDRRYGVIYADPPWKFAPYSGQTGMDRAADNHYPTMTLENIKALAVPAADDCVLFLWATVPMLVEAIEVLTAWSFTYKSHCIWDKQAAGTGYWFRNQHEILLVGTRGNIPAPAQGTQYSSIQSFPAGKHSEKPLAFIEMIDDLFPTLPKLEMFAREQHAGWECWGNEIDEASA